MARYPLFEKNRKLYWFAGKLGLCDPALKLVAKVRLFVSK